MMSKIKAILWDIDGTILNFAAAERAGIRKGFRNFQLGECTDEMLKEYSAINDKYWQMLERGEISKPEVLEGRFQEFFSKYGLDVSLVKAFNEEYQVSLADVIEFEPGARELIWSYAGKYKQYAASNGTALAQKGKLERSGLKEVLDGAFISDVIGIEKPMKGFFDAVFAELKGLEKEEIMIIGDSLTSDMKGGIDAGIVTCWYNPGGKKNDKNLYPDYEIRSLLEVEDILKNN